MASRKARALPLKSTKVVLLLRLKYSQKSGAFFSNETGVNVLAG
jgi:hypothetical protein